LKSEKGAGEPPAIPQPQENREEPEPQDEDGVGETDSEPLEELKQQDITFSGFFSPQDGHVNPSPPSSIF
jgi:hypothetical protein